MPSLRRQARSFAVQILYQTDVTPPAEAAQVSPADLERFWSAQKSSVKVRRFAENLVTETLTQHEAIDTALANALEEWRLERLPVPVRAILRLATCELLHICEAPRGAVINEAVELTRDFVDEDSARFVNAVLDKLPAPEAPQSPAPKG